MHRAGTYRSNDGSVALILGNVVRGEGVIQALLGPRRDEAVPRGGSGAARSLWGAGS